MNDENQDDDIPATDGDGAQRLYTADEVSAIVQKRLARQPKQAKAQPQQQPQGNSGTDAALAQLVQLKLAEALGSMTAAKPQPLNERPASDRGSPATSIPLVEQDLVTMSESDRLALIKEKGSAWYRQQLAKQLKGRPVTLR